MKLLYSLVVLFVLFLFGVESLEPSKFLFPPGFNAGKNSDGEAMTTGEFRIL